MNGLPVLALFDSGPTRSFLSLQLSKRFDHAHGQLDYPLEVKIADDRSVSVSRVHQGCTLELFQERYPIDLIPIPLRKS